MRRLGPLYGGAVALVHSTPWRWPGAIGPDDRFAARAAGWIVAVGAPIGVVAWIAATLVHAAGMPTTIASIVGLAALSLASAALVERGLAEQIDRWGGRARPESPSALATVVLVFATLVRAAAIVALPPSRWLAVFVATAVVGRYAGVFLQAIGDPILDDDAPRSLVATPAPAWLTAALGLGVATVAVLALGKAGIAAVAITAAVTFALGLDAQRRDRGLTAPVVATAAAVGELAVLLIATIGA
jgi:adenosylcobinamide-GDP ribazoletransferase